ncbi:hypothetical protein [Silvibacterium acidisoli]|uniref:hypothetical protein n=1 Tax=Acidobacteriaceae bacterium ZG23-2 TaxID=2883246 RepID=UPI00406C1F63
MPALELKVAETVPPVSSTRLRALLEKPNAVVLRRNHLVQPATGDDPTLHGRLRVTSVLAVDITNPPQVTAGKVSGRQDDDYNRDEEETGAELEKDEFEESFAKGVEIFIGGEKQSFLVMVDYDELSSALSLFDAYGRISKYEPAFLRLDQRSLGITYTFKEGLVVGLSGDPEQFREKAESFFHNVPVLAHPDDCRLRSFSTRLPHSGIAYMQALLQEASEWLNQNSYGNILSA